MKNGLKITALFNTLCGFKSFRKSTDAILAFLPSSEEVSYEYIKSIHDALPKCINVTDFVTKGRVFTDYPTLKPYRDEIKSITSL